MMELSPKNRRANINLSTIVTRGMSLKHDNDSDEDLTENKKHLKLPEIVLLKLAPIKLSETFDSIPGLKTTKNTKSVQKRLMTEKKTMKRELSIEPDFK
jgi:hypothetical protein